MTDPIAAFVEGLRLTHPFQNLPVSRPHNELWTAYNRTVLALRLPLYHTRLGKPRPKDKAFDEAIQMSLAMLAAFAFMAGTHRAIIRFEQGHHTAISFQPRPWEANWNAGYAMSPPTFWDPDQDPMTAHGLKPQVSTADILHLAQRVIRAYAASQQSRLVDGTATLEFFTDEEDQPSARLIWRDFGIGFPAQFVSLRRHYA